MKHSERGFLYEGRHSIDKPRLRCFCIVFPIILCYISYYHISHHNPHLIERGKEGKTNQQENPLGFYTFHQPIQTEPILFYPDFLIIGTSVRRIST